MAELAARSLHDQKIVGSNPAGSQSDLTKKAISLMIDDDNIRYDCYLSIFGHIHMLRFVVVIIFNIFSVKFEG